MILRRLFVLPAVLALLAQAPLAVADPDADWQSGHAAFAAGEFGAALEYFTHARDFGMDGPAVRYNIAVCQYELGDYDAARQSFEYIAGQFPKMRGLAEYNAGLAERRLGNPVAAQRRFIDAWHHSDDHKVRALAASQLTELGREQPSDWHAMVSLNAGHDDNVALRDSLGLPAGVSSGSPLVDVFATLDAPLPGGYGLALDSSLYAVHYPDANDFDQAELRAGLAHLADVDRWRIRSGLYLVAGTLGGSSFNEELNADLRLTHFTTDAVSLEFRLRYDEIRAAASRFESIEGRRSRIDFRYRWQRMPHYLVLRAGVEENDRLDPGVSPSRQGAQASYYIRLNNAWELEAMAGFRRSDYDDIPLPRREDQTWLTIGGSYDLRQNWRFNVRYQYSDNDSSDPEFSYDRNQVTVGMQYLF
jgi:tetratricopeptide (TPR) repeat protein